MPRLINTLGDARDSGQELVAICDEIRCRHRWTIDLDHVLKFMGTGHSLTPVRGEKHFSERMRCPACRGRGAFIWMRHMADPEPLLVGLSYSVNRWATKGSRALLEVAAKATSEIVANAAYDSAVGHYPGDHLTLQQRARIIRDSRVHLVRGGRAG
jgi:hypothetical protein